MYLMSLLCREKKHIEQVEKEKDNDRREKKWRIRNAVIPFALTRFSFTRPALRILKPARVPGWKTFSFEQDYARGRCMVTACY